MTRPKLVLPSQAMPWGRWVESTQDSIAAALARETQDADSAGNVFAGRADLIGSQIASLTSVAAIYSRSLPGFSQTRSTNSSASGYVYSAPAQSFNPPRPDRSYAYTVVASFDVAGTLFTFPAALLRTNGVDNMSRHENLQPGRETSATLSIFGSGNISPGQSVTAEVAVQGPAPGTANFTRVQLWCIFSGSIS